MNKSGHRSNPVRKKLVIHQRKYKVEIYHRNAFSDTSPRVVIVSYLPTQTAAKILRICLLSLRKFTPESHEVWVVDNNSPPKFSLWLKDFPGINIIYNRTEPLPPNDRVSIFGKAQESQVKNGSYANALALELAAKTINPQTHYLMTLHMDTMMCKVRWLSFLMSKLTASTKAAGVRLDTSRVKEGVLHVLGYIIDFQLFKKLSLDFFPDLPAYDVGDRVIDSIRKAGYKIFSCPNSYREPDLIDTLPLHSPFRILQVDRAFDDDGDVFFLHLGRGVQKASGAHTRGTLPEKWINFAAKHVLKDCNGL